MAEPIFIGKGAKLGTWNALTNSGSLDAGDGGPGSPGDPGYTPTSTLFVADSTTTTGRYHNTTHLTASVGDYWQVTTAGTFATDGYSEWALNDYVLFVTGAANSAGTWRRLSFTDTVSSVLVGQIEMEPLSNALISGSCNYPNWIEPAPPCGPFANDKMILFVSGAVESQSASFTGSYDFVHDYETGFVGLGTNSPTSILHIQGASGADTAITMATDAAEDDGDTWLLYAKNASDDVFQIKNNKSGTPAVHFDIVANATVANSTVSMRGNAYIASKLGIGTPSPENPLELLSNTKPQFRITNTDDVDYATFSVDTDGQLDITTVGGGSDLSHICLMPEGNVGIGTEAPDEIVHIQSAGSNPTVKIESTTTDEVTRLSFANDRTAAGDIASLIQTYNNGAAPITDIRGLRGSTDIKGDLAFHTSDSEQMRIDEDGNVGIGTTSPGELLDVNGNVKIRGNLNVDGSTTTVNSTTVTIDDPIFTLGGDTAPASDDNKDRGIEFRYHDSSVAKVGFFGWDDSAAVFTFIAEATNSSEVFSGAAGNVAFGATTITGDLTVDTNTLKVDSTNNRVGIGTASPEHQLELLGGDAAIPNIMVTGSVGLASIVSLSNNYAYSAASPCVVSETAHGLTTGTVISIYGAADSRMLGMWLVTFAAADTFQLTDMEGTTLDSTGFTAGNFILSIADIQVNGIATLGCSGLGKHVKSSFLTRVSALDGGTITSGFGSINNGSSTITTTGLISGGSLDIDNVVINGSTIGHTDDTDLLTLANGSLTVDGDLVVDSSTLKVDSTNDRVGIGTASPDHALDVHGASSTYGLGSAICVTGSVFIDSANSTSQNISYSATSPAVFTASGSSLVNGTYIAIHVDSNDIINGAYKVENATANTFTLEDLGGTDLAATTSGVVLISTANYSIDGTPVINRGGLGAGVRSSSLTSVGTLKDLTIAGDLTVDTNTLKVDSTNNRVGINQTTPGRSLSVNGTSGFNDTIYLGGNAPAAGGGNAQIQLDYAGVDGDILFSPWNGSAWGENLFLKAADGRVGIGTTSPAVELHVSGAVRAETIEFGSGADWIRLDSGDLKVHSDASIVLSAAGNVIKPPSDNTTDLGSSTARWANIYTGDLHLKNERGDWTVIEEESFLCVINNKTGKKYKMLMEEID